MENLVCIRLDNNNPNMNYGSCQRRPTDISCQTNFDCSSPSLYCKRVSSQNSLRKCYSRAEQGERCTVAGLVPEWENLNCLDTLQCALIDTFNPALGGICQTQGSMCINDQDCEYGFFCKRTSSTSFTKQCYRESIQGQTCNLASMVPEYAREQCLPTLQCTEIDVSNPSLGGMCEVLLQCMLVCWCVGSWVEIISCLLIYFVCDSVLFCCSQFCLYSQYASISFYL